MCPCLPVSPLTPPESGEHTHRCQQSALRQTWDCLSVTSQPRTTSKLYAGLWRREDEHWKLTSFLLLFRGGKCEHPTVKFLRHLHGMPFTNILIKRWLRRLRCWHSEHISGLSLMCRREFTKWQVIKSEKRWVLKACNLKRSSFVSLYMHREILTNKPQPHHEPSCSQAAGHHEKEARRTLYTVLQGPGDWEKWTWTGKLSIYKFNRRTANITTGCSYLDLNKHCEVHMEKWTSHGSQGRYEKSSREGTSTAPLSTVKST